MIELITQLENDPFHKEGKKIRGEVLVWLTEAPDVSVTLCLDVLGEMKKFKGDEGSALSAQFLFEQARFILEHADQAGDQKAINLAGVEGVLRTYERMKATKPKLKIEGADSLAALKASGGLEAHVAQRVAGCK
jgi:hypothetical protein